MLLVSWAGVRAIGKKSIAEMTAYDLAAIMLLTTVAAEPLVYKIPSKATLGVATLSIGAVIIGIISLKKFFYNVDSKPVILVVKGKVLQDELKKVKMNLPLLMSELRIKGYQNITDVEYAILEPSGKLSVVPNPQARPAQPKDLGVTPSPVNLSFPVIIDGKINKNNLEYFNKDENWLIEQLSAYNVEKVEEVFFAQIDSSGMLQVSKRMNNADLPDIS
jgi:uncharacterized membrane protein YcaP (DUF421 family)